jgi:hypothetical protein
VHIFVVLFTHVRNHLYGIVVPLIDQAMVNIVEAFLVPNVPVLLVGYSSICAIVYFQIGGFLHLSSSNLISSPSGLPLMDVYYYHELDLYNIGTLTLINWSELK